MVKAFRRDDTTEFKEEAVRLVQGGQSVSAAAGQLGLSKQTQFKWRGASADRDKAKNPKRVAPDQMELSRLRTEVMRLKYLCGALSVSPSVHASRKRGGLRTKQVNDVQLLALIRSIHAEFKGAYGWQGARPTAD